MKSFELEAKIRFYGLSKKQFASLLGVHYQTVFGWLTGRSQVSCQAINLLNQLEIEFDKAFDFSYRFLESQLNETGRAYSREVYIPLFDSLRGYKRYGTMEREPAYPIDFYQMLTISVARAWKAQKTAPHVIGVDADDYESWCADNKVDCFIETNLIQWMKNELSRRSEISSSN